MKTSLLFVLLFLIPVKVDFFKQVQSLNNSPLTTAQVSLNSDSLDNIPRFIDHNEIINTSLFKTKLFNFYRSEPWFYSVLKRELQLFSLGSRSPPLLS